jgi:hypothetical protein
MGFLKRLGELAHSPPLPVIVSFPKSGRSWYLVLLSELSLKVRLDHAGSDLGLAKPLEEMDTSKASNYSQIALLVRDPRDAVVSGYYHLRDRSGQAYPGTIGDFIRDRRFGMEKAIRFNLMWSDFLAANSGLCISYEDTHADAYGTLRKVLSFFGESRPDDQVQQVADRNSFLEMRGREERGEYGQFGKALGATRPGDPLSLKLRKGQVSGYRDDLNQADLSYCDAMLQQSAYFSHMARWQIPHHQALGAAAPAGSGAG